jgi:Zn-dependent peptidase ImmA (M78 family)
VDSFESLKALLDGYRVLTDTASSEQPLKGNATLSQSPQKVADKVRSCLLPEIQIKDHKEFLKGIIKKLARLNVYVFEFVETWNKKEKASIDGFYISPNVIVLKRQQSYKREIFTLAHEIGHYLLGKEEIDSLDMAKVEERRMHNLEERWCNDFAFFLIAGDAVSELDKFDSYSEDVNMMIDHLSSTTHISRMAWYTRLAYERKVPAKYYHAIIRQIEEETVERKLKEKEEKRKEPGIARSPKPIISPLYMETMQHAFFNGLVSEAVFAKKLGIPKNQIDKYLC